MVPELLEEHGHNCGSALGQAALPTPAICWNTLHFQNCFCVSWALEASQAAQSTHGGWDSCSPFPACCLEFQFTQTGSGSSDPKLPTHPAAPGRLLFFFLTLGPRLAAFCQVWLRGDWGIASGRKQARQTF